MFWRIVLVIVPTALEPPGGVPRTSTSTRWPGTTKPATPTTSFTRMATARIPGGMVADMPAPAPLAARRPSSSGSPS